MPTCTDRDLSPIFISVVLAAISGTAAAAQPGPRANAILVSGNGQVVEQSFATTAPMTIEVTDASGMPVSGVPVSWSIICSLDDIGCDPVNTGTLQMPSNVTDANGLASTNYIQTFVTPGASFTQATVVASTSAGNVSFRVTAAATLSSGLPPLSAFIVNPGSNGTVTGPAGTTLMQVVQVSVSAITGFSGGQGIPNVGVRIVDALNPSATPPASCNAPGGIVLTDSSGFATCDLVLGSAAGVYRLATDVGGGQADPEFLLIIMPGQTCTFTLTPTAQAFPSNASNGTINVTTQDGCGWTALSNAAFITVTSGASGNGNGTVRYSIAANATGSARWGTISIAGQTFTATQSATGFAPGPLAITSGSLLPTAVQNQSYSTTLTATGGTGVYSWTVTSGSLPPGLTLSPAGVISGVPTTQGVYPFTITVTDTNNTSLSQAFTIAAGPAGSGLTILTTSLSGGTVGVSYSQALLYSQTLPCGGPVSTLPVFTITSGSLPPGLSIQFSNNGFSIAGTPTTPGSYPFALVLANSCSQSAPVVLTIVISGSGVSAGCTYAISPGSQNFPMSGGNGSVNITTQAGCTWFGIANEPGFVLVTSGSNGIGNGTLTYVVVANNGPARSGTILVAGHEFVVNQSGSGGGTPLAILTQPGLAGAAQGQIYSAILSATGGTGSYIWTLTSGTPPPGLTVTTSQNAGVVSGVPTGLGTYQFTVTVNDSGGASQSRAFTIVVGAAGSGSGLTILTTSAPNGARGTAYLQPLQYSQSLPCGGPFAPLPVFTVSSGVLPPGLSIQYLSNGFALTGTPTTAGVYPFTLTLSNSCSQSAPVALTIQIQ